MIHGYARVSTANQSLQSQLDALAFCDQAHQEVATTRGRLLVLEALLKNLESGDTLVVTRLDRLGRSVVSLLRMVETLAARGVHLRVLAGNIDTTTAQGRFFLSMVAAMAEMERDLVRERTTQGLKAARDRGVKVGRPPALTPEKLAAARELLGAGLTPTQAARALGVGRSSMYRAFPSGDPNLPGKQDDLF